MDDLTTIAGIGAATAKKLVAGGIDSYAKLAAATHEQLEALRISGGADDHLSLIKAAADLGPAPIDLNSASAEDVAAQAAKIDSARLRLAQLADSAVLAFGTLTGLSVAGSETEFNAAQAAFDTTMATIHAAVADARALLGVSEDAPLPAALLEELAALNYLPPFVPPVTRAPTHSSVPAPATIEVPSKEPATDEQTSASPFTDDAADAHAFLADVIRQARSAAAAGELAEAGEYLRQHRTEIRAGQVLLAELLAGINEEIEALDQIQATAPVEYGVEVTAKVDSRWRIGRQFGKAATPFEPGELAADELEALKADPLLVVTEVH